MLGKQNQNSIGIKLKHKLKNIVGDEANDDFY